MKNTSCLLVIILFSINTYSQEIGFPFGKVNAADLGQNQYPLDTAASAIYLKEYGEAFIDASTFDLNFAYHAVIKILKTDGLEVANFQIPLYHRGNNMEQLLTIQASSFNIENNQVREVVLDKKNVFTEDPGKYVILKKFAVPNVRVGSIIEIMYTISSPYIMNFHEWEFQGDYPKLYSEYAPLIPANYNYNISLRGYLPLKKSESKVVEDCLLSGNGGKASCARHKFVMENIPAFKEEDYMTAKANFLSAIHFELTEIKYFTGGVNKITKSWKDVGDELRRSDNFGIQIKRGKDIVDTKVDMVTLGETDQLKKAKAIYNFIRQHYRWNNFYGIYSDLGIKKAFDSNAGNVADINLSLIAALRYAGLDAEPVLLSTRSNGVVTELYPVMSEFNYVIAKLNIDTNSYLLDATDDLVPFGLLPERCLNGKGRALGADSLYWVDLKPSQRDKTISTLSLNLSPEGKLTGSISTTYLGYAAVDLRGNLSKYNSQKEYFDKWALSYDDIEIVNAAFENVEDVDKSVVEKIEFTADLFPFGQKTGSFNPFLGKRWSENPFKSTERSYPVDFGPSLEQTVIMTLNFPSNFEIVNVPEKVGVALPNNGGRFITTAESGENSLKCSYMMLIAKPVYSPAEYHYLRELFNLIVQAQNNDLLIHKKD